jgi:outer membrane lipoprotein-sorting protein
MKRFLAAIATCVVLTLTSMAFARDGSALNAHQKDVIGKVSAYFTAIHTMQGNFLQTDSADRRMKGKFYLSRPGRFRFDYARPSRQIIVSDGQYLSVQDLDLDNEDRVALDQTPFRLVLSSDVDLARDAKVLDVEESDDLIVVELQDRNGDAPGQLKLFLATKPQLELKGWAAKDAEGVETRIEISDLAKDVQLGPEMFKVVRLAWSE